MIPKSGYRFSEKIMLHQKTVTGLTGSGAVLRYPARDEMRPRCLAEELPANGQAGASHDAAALDHDRACHCRDCQHLRRVHEDSHIR
jgi:hypothetical protein